MKNIFKNKWVLIIIVLIVGIIIGKLISPSVTDGVKESSYQHIEESAHQIWTCSMHPQIRMDKPGKCPICGMDLILADDNNQAASDPNEVSMTEEAMKLAEIQIMVVEKSKPEKEIRLLGKIKPDERLLNTQAVHIPGRIEKLYVNFTGEKIVKGQKIAKIYSPELVTAQKELFEAIKSKTTYPELYQASKNKLKLWKLNDNQIEAIEKKGEVVQEIDVLADYSGIVMKRNIELGDYVKEGTPLFDLADLSKVWVMFEAYETDIPWIHEGDNISFTINGEPRNTYNGTVNYIDPFVDAKTRITNVRVEVNNSQLKLLPEMYANGIVKADLKGVKNEIIIPKSAILWTGKRAIVYVKVPNREMTSFVYREIILGEDVGEFYVVKNGLEEGEEIAVNGVFRIDASAQLSSKKSMMNPSADGGKTSTGHNHGNMKAGEKTDETEMANMKKKIVIDQSKIPAKFKSQLGTVVNSYLLLKEKLTNDNANIQTDVKAIQKSLKTVDMSLVMEDAHNEWMKALNSLNKELKLLEKAVNIEEQRNHFLTISKSLSDAVQKLGIQMEADKTLYIEFCPMANENKGGYWLSLEKEIKNPYFGKKMLKCGEVKATIKTN
ncbi:MAG: efflux RND transporter periplasmic adaptor subunit [Bacteroidetes bacterium]|nr:efflux RND transporter periplasmic adaptor subunit [Bacteroidota bacterium]